MLSESKLPTCPFVGKEKQKPFNCLNLSFSAMFKKFDAPGNLSNGSSSEKRKFDHVASSSGLQKHNDQKRRRINFVPPVKFQNSTISSVEILAKSNLSGKSFKVSATDSNLGDSSKTLANGKSSTLSATSPVFSRQMEKQSAAQSVPSSQGMQKVSSTPSNALITKENHGLFNPTLVEPYLKWSKGASVGPGFYNEGNTCYLNSTLQCLLYIPSFIQLLLQESKTVISSFKKNNNVSSNGNQQQKNGSNHQKNNFSLSSLGSPTSHSKSMIELFMSLAHEVHISQNTNKAISPRSMTSSIKRIGKQFRHLRQEDAHEYMRQLLDYMNEEILKGNNLKPSNGKIAETTFISRVFGGYLCNTLKCPNCLFCSKTFNHFQDLSLDLKQGINNIDEAIKHFTKSEQLTNGNEWKCEKCLKKVKAIKQMTFSSLPNVLVLHLKRFSFGNMFGKITKHINFQPEITLSTNSTANNNKYRYVLTGIIVHFGHSTHSGHYIAYIKVSSFLLIVL
jgi:ubiquitin carboxyl-terminal hydrolase 36/42